MNKKLFVIHFVVGIIVALLGAFIMFHGSIFRENNSGIATVINIIGIGIIASSYVWSTKK
ncbi:hypothetical protein AYK25_08000 [Thermoplasmatales archaeon SM1-50]|nr:MAG: hypothetical protein AYK25_08000 [Thermoplasmatales archaeon SM1-50]